MVERTTWIRGVALVGLIAVAFLFYSASNVQPTSRPMDGLVFTNQYFPLIEEEMEERAVIPENVDGEDNVLHVTAPVEEQPSAVAAEPSIPTAVSLDRLASFDQFRANRLRERSRRLESMETMLERSYITEEQRSRLHEELLQLMALFEKEEQAEGLLVARGLYDAVVLIGSNSAEVVVPERITRDQAGQIGNVVARIAGMPLNQITIVDGAPSQ